MKPLKTDPARAEHIAEVLKAVAHPLRLRIVATLCEADAHVNGLAERLGASQPIVSQQLRILRSHGLVSATRRDGFARYRLAEPALRNLVCCMERCRR
ncbi:ArsR/SmtB family transcription factor [Anaeromyxobacter oryzae]|uniref:Transcriptional regulator n=1 Tax=Anaeromyxobacter oryzae TaxID=2918170 RepID=A0ABM7X2L8_9BACT|nr:metalloregulator ArsR/SmtB family transcription factor [Anaeromyxobacter oryzae]BDG06038.1 transcriptional regulator [Anaeromyxobacter oryzae]